MGVVSGSATCTQGYGVGLTDMGVHIADITGDGKAGSYPSSSIEELLLASYD